MANERFATICGPRARLHLVRFWSLSWQIDFLSADRDPRRMIAASCIQNTADASTNKLRMTIVVYTRTCTRICVSRGGGNGAATRAGAAATAAGSLHHGQHGQRWGPLDKLHRKREVAVEGSHAKHELFSQPLGSDNSARRQAHPCQCEAEPTLLDLYSRVLSRC